MTAPQHPRRFPTRDAIDSLSRRFGLRNHPHMQDWEWEVADPKRVNEFLAAYEAGALSEDERFTLMEVLIQSCEDLPGSLDGNESWARVLRLLECNIDLHIDSVRYWAESGGAVVNDSWRVTPFLRELLNRSETAR